MKRSSSKSRFFESVNKLKPIKKRKLYEDIVDQIKSLVEKGGLKSGDQLPPERELSEIFQVSRNSVREALRTLEENQILRSRPGDGTYVIGEDETLIIESLARAIHHEKKKLSEIFQFRRLIEPQIASLAARNASAQEIKELERIVQEQGRAVKDAKKSVELDNAFHLSLARASKNTILLRIVQALNDILGETRAEFLQKEPRRLKSLEGHSKIVETTRQRKKGLARKAMNEHLKKIEEMIID